MNYMSVWRRPQNALLRDFGSTQRLLDSFFDDVYGNRPNEATDFNFSPQCEVHETKTHYNVSVDLPGLKKDEIKLELNDDSLVISGERRRETSTDEKDHSRHLAEVTYGSFMRRFTFPTPVNAERAEAKHENGVLHIAIPKSETSKARQISIK